MKDKKPTDLFTANGKKKALPNNLLPKSLTKTEAKTLGWKEKVFLAFIYFGGLIVMLTIYPGW